MGKLEKIERFIRRVLKRCQHEWHYHVMNPEEEIVSSTEYSLQKCAFCRKMKYRKL